MVVQQLSIYSSLVCLRGFLQERQVEPCIGFGGVSHVTLDRPRCVFMHQQKTQTSVVALCGVQRMESDVRVWSWRSVTEELFLCHGWWLCSIAVVDGTVEISRMRISSELHISWNA